MTYHSAMLAFTFDASSWLFLIIMATLCLVGIPLALRMWRDRRGQP